MSHIVIIALRSSIYINPSIAFSGVYADRICDTLPGAETYGSNGFPVFLTAMETCAKGIRSKMERNACLCIHEQQRNPTFESFHTSSAYQATTGSDVQSETTYRPIFQALSKLHEWK